MRHSSDEYSNQWRKMKIRQNNPYNIEKRVMKNTSMILPTSSEPLSDKAHYIAEWFGYLRNRAFRIIHIRHNPTYYASHYYQRNRAWRK